MPYVDENRLKGNYAAAYVSARLSGQCLVRPVATDTDVGVDLFCETVEANKPFLHFWVQVKSGSQCRMKTNGTASSSFSVEHLGYWYRQPVPVFAALVPVEWPVTADPTVYIINVTTELLGLNEPPASKSMALSSTFELRPGNRDDVRDLLENFVPRTAAQLRCRDGVVARIPTVTPTYEHQTPEVPVARYQKPILGQIRRTAANSLLFLYRRGELNEGTTDFRRTLASIVAIFGDDQHWENFMSRALSHHCDNEFDEAVDLYGKAVSCIQNDRRVASVESWREQVREIEELCGSAKAQKPLQ